MVDITFTQTNVSQVGVLAINADNTLRSTQSNTTMTFGAVVVSPKGKPFEVMSITDDTWEDLLGDPYHSSYGWKAESLRHIAEAAEGGNGIVVRVVPSDATYPVIKITHDGTTQATSNEGVLYGEDVSLDSDLNEQLAIYVVDGAESDLREISLEVADADTYGDDMWLLTLTEEDDAGNVETLEEHYVSFDIEATDDMGSATYIKTVLERDSDYLEAEVGSNPEYIEAMDAVAFTGASNGDIADITADDYQDAVEVLSSTMKSYNHVIGAGCYETEVIKSLITICNNRRIGGSFDINPRLNYDEACQAKVDMAINEHRACFYYMPFSCTDPYHGNRSVWGLSGVAFAAKAAGVAKTSPTGSWHLTPAGSTRAAISRTAMREIAGYGDPDYDWMYTCRLNKLDLDENGNPFIDDSLTSSTKENYLRFENVVALTDAISRQFYALANSLKHEDDDTVLDGLTDGMTEICDNFVSVGALVTPRNPDEDGEEPYIITVTQDEIDAWTVEYAICPSGSARRIMGEPILIR